jgi:hypothetical protein
MLGFMAALNVVRLWRCFADGVSERYILALEELGMLGAVRQITTMLGAVRQITTMLGAVRQSTKLLWQLCQNLGYKDFEIERTFSLLSGLRLGDKRLTLLQENVGDRQIVGVT